MTDDVLENNKEAAHSIENELAYKLVATQGRLTDDLAELVAVVKMLVTRVNEIDTAVTRIEEFRVRNR